ncbi:MAG: hypothetical protein E7337_09110, partial [Clostridiales bacterium]|nr:hypothetical protein [Clostridiales bacterium]
MKRIITVFLAVLLAFGAFSSALAEIADGQSVQVIEGGMDNVNFGDSFYGFCIDQKKKGSNEGDTYTATFAQNNVKNNVDSTDVSNLIKIFFVEYFQQIFGKSDTWLYGEFTKDSSGNFKVSKNEYAFTAAVIWGLTDNYVSTNATIAQEAADAITKVKQLAAGGLTIPDGGYIATYDVGSMIGPAEVSVSFEFKVFISENTALQDFIAYRAHSVEKPAATATPTPTAVPTPTPTAVPTPTPTAVPTPT